MQTDQRPQRIRRFLTDDMSLPTHKFIGLSMAMVVDVLPRGAWRGGLILVSLALIFGRFRKPDPDSDA